MQYNNTISIPITPSTPTDLVHIDRFDDVVDRQLQKHPEIARYLKDLDAYSTETFNHSINVALLTFTELLKKGMYSEEEIEEWVGAALVHDAGKLTIPIELLHANGNLSKDDISQLMRHSIDGLRVALDYNFSDICTAAVIGHHLSAEALETPNFENIGKSKHAWCSEFGESYVKDVMKEHLGTLTETEKRALEILTFCDQIEALRSNERSYKSEILWAIREKAFYSEWNKAIMEDTLSVNYDDPAVPKDQNMDPFSMTVESIMAINMKYGYLNKSVANRVYDDNFRKTSDFLLTSDEPTRTREIISYHMLDTEYGFSKDKIKDILKNPKVALEFMEKAIDKTTGQDLFVVNIGQGHYVAIPPDAIKPAVNAEIRQVFAGDIRIIPKEQQYFQQMQDQANINLPNKKAMIDKTDMSSHGYLTIEGDRRWREERYKPSAEEIRNQKDLYRYSSEDLAKESKFIKEMEDVSDKIIEENTEKNKQEEREND